MNTKSIQIEVDYAALEKRILLYSIKDVMGTYKLFQLDRRLLAYMDRSEPCSRPDAPWSDIE